MGETIARNRRAHHDYSIEETFEAGIVLRGTEIKSIRDHKVSLADAYARIERGEAWIIGLHIAPWGTTDVRFNHEPKRARKLLLHRREIDELLGKTKAQGPHGGAAVDLPVAGQGEDGAGPGPRQADLGPAARDRGPGRETGHGATGRRVAAALKVPQRGATAAHPARRRAPDGASSWRSVCGEAASQSHSDGLCPTSRRGRTE